MDIDLAALPADVKTLQRMVRLLASARTSLSEAQAEIERLHLIIKKLQRSQFGRRAERLDDDQLQLGFEDLNADLARAEAILPSARTKTARTQDERSSLPAHLPREDVRFDVERQDCPCCGGKLHLIGETVSEMLDHLRHDSGSSVSVLLDPTGAPTAGPRSAPSSPPPSSTTSSHSPISKTCSSACLTGIP